MKSAGMKPGKDLHLRRSPERDPASGFSYIANGMVRTYV